MANNVQTNQYGQTYIGNDDFRGWLAANGVSEDDVPASLAKGYSATQWALDNIGNDGKSNGGIVFPTIQKYYDYWLNQRNQGLNNQADYTTSYSSSASDAASKQRLLDYYNDMIARKEESIGKLDAGLQNDLDQLKGQYDIYKNEQQSAYDREKNSYDEASRQNRQNLQNSRNEIDQKAALGLRSLKSILGGMGAGGSSVALYNAPQMVKSVADSGYAGANTNFASNQSDIDATWGNYQNDYENDQKKLEDWRIGQEKTAKQNVEKQRISLLEELSDFFGNRAALTDAGVGDNVNNITKRINAANDAIIDLGKYEAPNYTGMTAVYKTPSLSKYNTGQVDLSGSVQSNNAGDSSLLTMLRGLKKKSNVIGA